MAHAAALSGETWFYLGDRAKLMSFIKSWNIYLDIYKAGDSSIDCRNVENAQDAYQSKVHTSPTSELICDSHWLHRAHMRQASAL